jgi:FkbM family methyltransferase
MPSQFDEDVLIARWLPRDALHLYIDVGAGHPVDLSNTHLLHEQGWAGMCVEPDPGFAALLREARPKAVVRECVVSEYDHPSGDFFVVEEDRTLSTADPFVANSRSAEGKTVTARAAPYRSLASLLIGVTPMFLSPGVLSIDVEGEEEQVLDGCPWGAGFSPALIVIEATVPCTMTPSHESWERALLRQGYRCVAMSPINRIYTKDAS